MVLITFYGIAVIEVAEVIIAVSVSVAKTAPFTLLHVFYDFSYLIFVLFDV